MKSTRPPQPSSANSSRIDSSPLAKLTPVQLSMFGPATSSDSPNVISSPESVAGQEHFNSPAGPKIEKSGLEAVPVSRFRALDKEKVMPTKDTCGPLFIGSSPSAVLQHVLESRLQASLDVNGSPEYALTWKELDMPSGPPICALRASGRRTSDSGFTGWPTPNTITGGKPGSGCKARGGRNSDIQEAAELADWPTPRVDESTEDATTMRPSGSSATLAGWPTPNLSDDNNSRCANPQEYSTARLNRKNACSQLADTAQALCSASKEAGWATPTSRDYKDGGSDGKVPENGLLGRMVWASGPTPSGTPAATEKTEESRVLNPAFSAWLMGYEKKWTLAGWKAVSRLRKKSKAEARSSKATETPCVPHSQPSSL